MEVEESRYTNVVYIYETGANFDFISLFDITTALAIFQFLLHFALPFFHLLLIILSLFSEISNPKSIGIHMKFSHFSAGICQNIGQQILNLIIIFLIILIDLQLELLDRIDSEALLWNQLFLSLVHLTHNLLINIMFRDLISGFI